jgi:hypothetical protein
MSDAVTGRAHGSVPCSVVPWRGRPSKHIDVQKLRAVDQKIGLSFGAVRGFSIDCLTNPE